MAGSSSPTTFLLVGVGSRAGAYLRIAEALPDRFSVTGIVARDPAKAVAVEKRFGVPTHRSVQDALRHGNPTFAVSAVRPPANPGVVRKLVDASLPVLSETPPGSSLDELDQMCELVYQGARIQVAEQVRYRPMHAARLGLIATGVIGEVSQVQVSVAHGYHGTSLIRALLGIAISPVTIEARSFTSPLLCTPGRHGIPGAPTVAEVKPSRQVLGLLWFPGKLALYDFTVDQYYSGARSPRVLVRGERGEIQDDDVRRLDGAGTLRSRLERVQTGQDDDLRGFHLEGIMHAGEWVYVNPFAQARLSDDEIAVATVLDLMTAFVRTGTEFCSVREAADDRYLELMLEQAVASGEPIRVEPRYRTGQ